MFFLVTIFEDIDSEYCKKMNISPGFKVVNRIAGRYVDGFAGYRFWPNTYDEDIESQSRKIDVDGTATTFGMLLSEINDVRLIPDTVDVEAVRYYWIRTDASFFIGNDLLETIEEHGAENLRKCLYRFMKPTHLCLIDILNNKVVFDTGSARKLEEIIPKYLWVPVKEATEDEISNVDLCPFKYQLIKPDNNSN
ncbi:hypothetical protein AAG584_15900 [Vreelandella titanicae]|uniref:hypothetical protein n=1 Tax=Vreelandella titanicae TaxID=664683 RepID=UPI00315A2D08